MTAEDLGLARPAPTSSASLLGTLRDAALSTAYVSLGQRRTSSPHEFYRYPARFSPDFAAAAIQCFSSARDTILDPFVGGGTTAVEAIRLRRRVIASDLNPLATFVTRAKTTALDEEEQAQVRQWLREVQQVRLTSRGPTLDGWARGGYFKDLDGPDTWRIRKLIALVIAKIPHDSAGVAAFCRCIVLRTGQWALDMRSTVPKATEFREALVDTGTAMLEVHGAWSGVLSHSPRAEIHDVGVPGLAEVIKAQPISLVLTSPPYPGVYVNYHRWKLRGRREIPAPYWITGRLDGRGLSHYTMGARAEPTLTTYFRRLRDAFADIALLLSPDTVVVQLVGFNEVNEMLPRYLETMREVGLEELTFDELATEPDGRLWRNVPNRRWWNEVPSRKHVSSHSAREVVLVHRRAI